MNSDTITQTQDYYRQMNAELTAISEKICDFSKILLQINSEFENGNTISTETFERLMRIAQEYYTLDMELKERLPDVTQGEGYHIERQKAQIDAKLEELDKEMIRNSVNAYFGLHTTDAERAEELEETKEDLRRLLSDPDQLDIAAIRPYISILQLVEDQDKELPDELMDEVDDTFSRPFVRAVLRGKLIHDGGTGNPSVSISGHSQTLE